MNNKLGWLKDIKAIGWDLDGTLYPPNCFPPGLIDETKYRAVMKANNWDMGKAREEFGRVYADLGSNTKTLTALGLDGSNFFTDLWDELPLGDYIKHDQQMIDMFSALSSKRHFMITNSNTKVQVEKKLGLVGLSTDLFEVIVTTDVLGAVKPDPKPFLEALKLMRLEPEQTLFVGDRLTTDIRGANDVGMKTCLVWSESSEADICHKDVYQISKMFISPKVV